MKNKLDSLFFALLFVRRTFGSLKRSQIVYEPLVRYAQVKKEYFIFFARLLFDRASSAALRNGGVSWKKKKRSIIMNLNLVRA